MGYKIGEYTAMKGMSSQPAKLNSALQQPSYNIYLFSHLIQLATLADHLDMAKHNSSQQPPENPLEPWGTAPRMTQHDGSFAYPANPQVDPSSYQSSPMYARSHAPPSPPSQRAAKRPAYGGDMHSSTDTVFQADDTQIVAANSYGYPDPQAEVPSHQIDAGGMYTSNTYAEYGATHPTHPVHPVHPTHPTHPDTAWPGGAPDNAGAMTRQWAHATSAFIPTNLPPAPNLSGTSSASPTTSAPGAPPQAPTRPPTNTGNVGRFVPSQSPNYSQPTSATPDLSRSKSKQMNWGSASAKSAPARTLVSSAHPRTPDAPTLAWKQPNKSQLTVGTSNAVRGAPLGADIFAVPEHQPTQGSPSGLPSNPASPSGSHSGSAVARKTFIKAPSHLSQSSVAPDAPTAPEIPVATKALLYELARGSGEFCDAEFGLKRQMTADKQYALQSQAEAWLGIKDTAGVIKVAVQDSHGQVSLDARANAWLERFVAAELKAREQRFEFMDRVLRNPPDDKTKALAESYTQQMFNYAVLSIDLHPIVQTLINILNGLPVNE